MVSAKIQAATMEKEATPILRKNSLVFLSMQLSLSGDLER
jgi:hypothetical protein